MTFCCALGTKASAQIAMRRRAHPYSSTQKGLSFSSDPLPYAKPAANRNKPIGIGLGVEIGVGVMMIIIIVIIIIILFFRKNLAGWEIRPISNLRAAEQ